MEKEKQKEIQIKESRSSLVVQSNRLIRDVKTIQYGLTNQQQKLIVFLISKICKEDKQLKRVSFNISEYCDVCGIQKSGREYQRIKESIKQLRDKSYWISDDSGNQILFAWLDTAIMRKNKTVELVISEALRPYLVELSSNFCAYQLINALCLRGKYSLNLYQICHSYLWLGKWETSVLNFREMMFLNDKYPSFKEMKRNVIDNSLREINKYTDIKVSYSTERQGRNISKIIFTIEEVSGYQMSLDLYLNQEERLAIRGE